MGIWCWGRNEQRSELGSGDQGSSTCPSPFSADLLPSSRNVTQVALGQDHILILAQGEVWSCGSNDHGQLGLGNKHSSPRATAIPQLSRSRVDVCAISAGDRHSLALSTTGSVFVWGSNDSGQLGLGVDHGSLHHFPVLNINLEKARFVVCGGNHSIVGLEAGGTFAFGCNEFGQLGIGRNVEERRVCKPTLCILSSEVSAAAAGGHHTIFVDADRSVWACGRGISGQLGLGVDNRVEAVWIPTRITTLDDALRSDKHGSTRDVVEQVACGTHHSAVRTRLGNIYTFGSNLHGQLGHGLVGPDQSGIFSMPRLVRYDSERNPVGLISNISCGHDHTMVVSDKGHVMSWGDNSCGQLGQGSRSSSCASLPSRVRMQQDCRGARLFAGGQFSLLLIVEQSGLAVDVQGGLLQAELEETRQKLSAMKSIVGELEDVLRQQQQQVHLAQDAQRVGDERKDRALEEAAKVREMARKAGNELLGNIESVSQIVESVKDVVKSENAALEEAERSRAERAKEASERMEANVEALEKQLMEAKKNAEEARKEAERERQREEELEKKLEQEKKNAEEARKEAEIEQGKVEKLGQQLEEHKEVLEGGRKIDENVQPETRKLDQGAGFSDVSDADVDSTVVERKGTSILKAPLILPLQGGFTLEYTAGGLGNVKVNEKVTSMSLTSGGELTETLMSKKQGSGATVVSTGVGAAWEAKAVDEKPGGDTTMDEKHRGDAGQRDAPSEEAEEKQIAVHSEDMLRRQVVESDVVNSKVLEVSVASVASVDESDGTQLDENAAMTAPSQTSNGDADVAENTPRDAIVNTASSDAKAEAPTDEMDGEIRKDQLQQQASAQQEAQRKPSSGETRGVGSIKSADTPPQKIIEKEESFVQAKAGEEAIAETIANRESVADAIADKEAVADAKASEESVADAKASEESVADAKASEESVADAKASEESVAKAKASEESVAKAKASEESVADAKAGEDADGEAVAQAKPSKEAVSKAETSEESVAEAIADKESVADAKAVDESVADAKPSEESVADVIADEESVADAKAGEEAGGEAETSKESVTEAKSSDKTVAKAETSEESVAEVIAKNESVAEARAVDESVADAKPSDESFTAAEASKKAVAEAKADEEAPAEAKELGERSGNDADGAPAKKDFTAEKKGSDGGSDGANKEDGGGVETQVSTTPSSVTGNDSILDDSIADDVIEEGEDDEDQDYDPFSVANGD